MADRPLIADLRTRAGNIPRGSMVNPADFINEAAAPPPRQAEPPEAEEPGPPIRNVDAKDAPEKTEPKPEDLSPAERYRKRLEQAKISLADATAVYDAILDKDYYEEYVRIRNRRAVLRTRSYAEQLRVQTALELARPQTALGHDEILSRYNLAASLYEWDGKPVRHDTDADFENILKLILKLPQPVVSLLYDSLAKFDHKVMVVFSEGCTDSF